MHMLLLNGLTALQTVLRNTTEEGAEAAPWEFLQNGGSNSAIDEVTETIEGTLSSTYVLAVSLAVGVAAISLILAFMRIMATNQMKRENAKDTLFWVLIALFGISSVFGIISLIFAFSNQVFS